MLLIANLNSLVS